ERHAVGAPTEAGEEGGGSGDAAEEHASRLVDARVTPRAPVSTPEPRGGHVRQARHRQEQLEPAPERLRNGEVEARLEQERVGPDDGEAVADREGEVAPDSASNARDTARQAPCDVGLCRHDVRSGQACRPLPVLPLPRGETYLGRRAERGSPAPLPCYAE